MAAWVLIYVFVIQPYLMPVKKDGNIENQSQEQSKDKQVAEETAKNDKNEKLIVEDKDSSGVSENAKETNTIENEKNDKNIATEKPVEKSGFFDLYDKKFEYISEESRQGEKLVFRYSENDIIITKTFTINNPEEKDKNDNPKDVEPYITGLSVVIENKGSEEFKQKGYAISAGTITLFDPEPKITDISIFAQSASSHSYKPRSEKYTEVNNIEGVTLAGITNKYFATIIEPATDETKKIIKKVFITSLVPQDSPEIGSDGIIDENRMFLRNHSLGAMIDESGASAINFILYANDVVRGKYNDKGKLERDKNLAYHPTTIPAKYRPFAITSNEIENKKGEKEKILQYSLSIGTGEIVIPAGGKIEHKYLLYVGPKEYRRLKRLGYEKAMNFNRYLGPINIALLSILHWFYSLIPNYGVAILLLTIVIKIVLWPLDQKSYKSMKEMQKIQPLIAEVKAKYKDDPKKAQIKQMELFREHKVNPLGGCLPMLLQFPILIAMFSALRVGFELRGAPFMLWIDDLSQPDILVKFSRGILNIKSLNILPLIMVVVFYIQQQMSSTVPQNPSDPQYQQQKMMNRIFPIMFGFIFYNMQSGLTLYFTFSTLLRLAQQLLVIKKPEIKTETK